MQIQKEYSEDLANLVKRLFNQWKYPVIVVYGNPETGKTDFALLMVEIAKDLGVLDSFASNINTYDTGERITSLEEENYWFEHQAGTKCMVLDEAGVHDDSRSPLSRLNREIRHGVFVIRKFKGHKIFILQELEDLDKWKHSELTGAFVKKKTFEHEFIASIKTRWDTDLYVFRDIPKTTILYDTLDVAPYTLERQIGDKDVSLKGLPYEVAFKYAKCGNLSVVAKELEPKLGKLLKHTQAKRLLQQFCRDQLRIEVKRGRPKKTVEVEPKIESLL